MFELYSFVTQSYDIYGEIPWISHYQQNLVTVIENTILFLWLNRILLAKTFFQAMLILELYKKVIFYYRKLLSRFIIRMIQNQDSFKINKEELIWLILVFMNNKLPQSYSNIQAWLHDHLIGNRALNLHAFIIEHGNLESILAEKRDLQLLDVGCGGGQSTIRLKILYPHLQIKGIDLSEDQISRARKRAQQKGHEILFETADAQDLPYPDGSFDVVYSFGSAKHWPDPLKGFGECWRVLKSGGELLIADATSDSTLEEIKNFYDISNFPRLFKRPIVRVLNLRMFRPAHSVDFYQEIAEKLYMPPGTVSQLPTMPAFLFCATKS
jgi:ubiquinone/menaquinone biosynthesis C-methylase UbiE